jgi:hypothetical protein
VVVAYQVSFLEFAGMTEEMQGNYLELKLDALHLQFRHFVSEPTQLGRNRI